jgi:hypothetical protein
VHLGLIGGIGPAATEFYYRGLVRAHVSANRTMELTIVHADVRELLQNLTANAPHLQAKAFLRLALRLQAAGAEAMVNAIPEVEAELVRRGLRCVGIPGIQVVVSPWTRPAARRIASESFSSPPGSICAGARGRKLSCWPGPTCSWRSTATSAASR